MFKQNIAAALLAMQQVLSLEFQVKMTVRIEEELDSKHKDSLSKILAIASACHVAKTQQETDWYDFSAYLAHTIYLYIKKREFSPKCVDKFSMIKRANNIDYKGPMKLIYQGVMSHVLITVQDKKYNVDYELQVWLQPRNIMAEHSAIPQENLLITPPHGFFEIVENRHSAIIRQYDDTPNQYPQGIVNRVAGLCQPDVGKLDIWRKVTVKLSVCVKMRTDSEIAPEFKNLVVQKLALVMGIHLEHEATTGWRFFGVGSAWELFWTLRTLEFRPKVRYEISQQYEIVNLTEDALEKVIASHLYADCSVGSHGFFYEIEYGYYPQGIQNIDDIPFYKNVPLTRWSFPPAQFYGYFAEIRRRLKCLNEADDSPINMDELGKFANACCIEPIMTA